MGKLKKIGMGIGLTVLGFFVLVIIVGVTYHPSTTSSTQNNSPSGIDQAKIDEANKVTGVTNFEVTKLGSLYQARFSLVDANSYQVTSDAKVSLQVKQDDGTVVYSQNFDVHDSEFQTYKLQLTGAEFLAYVWQIDATKLPHGDLTVLKGYLTVMLPNGKTYTTDTSIF